MTKSNGGVEVNGRNETEKIEPLVNPTNAAALKNKMAIQRSYSVEVGNREILQCRGMEYKDPTGKR